MSAEYDVREYMPADIPALTDLWSRIFGDSRSLAASFFRLLPGMGSCFAAEKNGVLCGMASILTDLTLHCDEQEIRCAYLYAVAVEPRFRGKGIGAALSRAAKLHARQNGAELFTTLPAEPGLYPMYEKTVGTVFRLKRTGHTVAPCGDQPSSTVFFPAAAAEYNRKREELLKGETHLSVSDSSIAYLQALCREYGGDILLSEKAAAACTLEGGILRLAEILCADESREAAAARAAAQLHAEKAVFYLPSDDGEDYISYDRNILPSRVIWNTAFD